MITSILFSVLVFAGELPKDAASLSAGADAAFALKDYGKASQWYYQLLSVDPRACGAHYHLAEIAYNGGDGQRGDAELAREPAGCEETGELKRLRAEHSSANPSALPGS